MSKLKTVDPNSLKAGPRTFFSDFLNYVKRKKVDESLTKTVFVGVPFRKVDWSADKVLLRVNGLRIWLPFNLKNGVLKRFLFRLMNLPLFMRMLRADHLVFQSKASLKFWEWLFRFKKDTYTIIPNGLEVKSFKKTKSSERILFAFANWRPGLCLTQILKIMEQLQVRMPDVTCLVYGYSTDHKRWFDGVLNSNPKIRYAGVMSQEKMAELSAHTSIMLTLDYFASCPNAVLESLGSGIPVVGPASLGLAEIIPSELLFGVSFDPFDYGPTRNERSQPVFDINFVSDKLASIFSDYETYSDCKFLVDSCIEKEESMLKYTQLIKSL